jgi:dCTP deaminase
MTNLGGDDIIIRKNDRVVQMILHEVRENNQCYSGRYQDSRGAVEAK